jgi:hypothetical protein
MTQVKTCFNKLGKLSLKCKALGWVLYQIDELLLAEWFNKEAYHCFYLKGWKFFRCNDSLLLESLMR